MSHPEPGGALARVSEVLRPLCPEAPEQLQPEQLLVEDLGLDSVRLAQAVVSLEEAFGCELPQERLHELPGASLGELIAMLEEAAGRLASPGAEAAGTARASAAASGRSDGAA